MQFRQLEYLVALAREGHFARAAASCFVSQPTLSDGIRTLEAELGIEIVLRGHRFERFTPEGERLLAFARHAIRERDELLSELAVGGDGLAGRLRLGVIPTVLPSLPLLTTPFLTRYPRVGLSVLSLSSLEIGRRLKSFELDAGITYLDQLPIEHVHVLGLYEEHHLLLVTEGLVPDEITSISWLQAAELPLCLLTPDMQNRRIVDGLFRRAGAAPSARIETNSISTLLSHVRWGRFASVVPQSWLQPFGAPAGTRLLHFSEGEEPSTIGLVWLDREPTTIHTEAFLEVVSKLDVQPKLDSVLEESGPGPFYERRP